ncbi:MAG: ATP-binding protein [Patescibacteria group bacterium UBA2103]
MSVSNAVIQIVLFLTATINIIFPFIVFSRGVRVLKNILFALFSLSTALWAGAVAGFYFSLFEDLSLQWIEYTHSFALLSSLFFLIFTTLFPQNILAKRKRLLLPVIALAGVFLYLIFTTDLVIGASTGISYGLGPLYSWYSALVTGSFFLGYFLLFRQYTLARTELEKGQVRYVFLGAIISPTLALVSNLLFPYLGIFQFTWLGPVFTLVMVSMMFMAMARFKLFDVKIIVTELFAGFIILILLAQLFITQTFLALIITTATLVLVSIAAFLLIQSVYKEVKQRERIEKLAEDLRVANARLKELDRQKSEFVSIASHQLRSPITAIRGYISLILEKEFGEYPKVLEDPLQKIYESSRLMIKSVEDYLNISRIEQGRMKYEMSDFNLRDLAKTVVDEYLPVAENKNLNLLFSGSEKITVTADIGKIKQVIANLVDNSIKYTPQGSVTVKATMFEGKARVTVADTGIGIAKEDIDNLFNKFIRARGANKINTSGTGLGLYVAKQMVEAHKGRVWVESEGKGKGSRFIIELPVKNT